MDPGCKGVLPDEGHQAAVWSIMAAGEVVSSVSWHMTNIDRRDAQHPSTNLWVGEPQFCVSACLSYLNHEAQEAREEIHANKPRGQLLIAGKHGQKPDIKHKSTAFPYQCQTLSDIPTQNS